MATTNKNFRVKNGLDVGGNTVITGDANVTGKLSITASAGDEGGEIFLSNAATNTTITSGVTIDVYQNRLRFFEQGGDARGYYIDITGGGSGVSTNLVGGGSASNSFATVSANGTSVVADSSTDTLTITPGSGMSIVGNATSDTITFSVNGGLVPSGGTAGQILSKSDSTDYNTVWINEAPAASYTSVVKHDVRLAESITKGQAVYVSSSNGSNMVVSKASNATEGTSSKTLGLLESSGSTNNQRNVVTEGLLGGINVGAAVAGDPVWLGTSGNLIYGLTNKPIAPAHLVFIGIVTREGNNGEIFVRIQNGFELNEIHNVLIGTDYTANSIPGDNEVLAFDSTSGLWKNQTAEEAGVANLSGATFTGNVAGTNINVTGNVNAATVNATTFTGTAAFADTAFSVAISNVSSLGTNVSTFLTTPNSINFLNTITDETGTGNVVFSTSPVLTTPNIGAAIGTSVNVTGQLISTVAIGTAPLAVTSTTRVTNLNADFLDDLQASTANTASTVVARDVGGNIAANTATFVNVTATNGGNLNDGYRLRETLYITSTSSFLKASYPYLRAIKVKVVGGGGGGGGAPSTNATSTAIGGSGSGAGYSEFLITNIGGLAATLWAKVGAAGIGGSVGSNAGGTGGESWFGTSNTTTTTTYGHAYGGVGGAAGTAATGNRVISGRAGADVGLTGDLKVGGGASGSLFNASSNFVHSSSGGTSGLAYGGAAGGVATSSASDGNIATGYGGGGSGAACGNSTGTGRAGGDGTPGIVILELYA